MPTLNAKDQVIATLDTALRTLFAAPSASRPYPTPKTVDMDPAPLSTADKATAGALMRVNHVGEVCAQALYTAQALATKNPVAKTHFLAAAKEETDHLAWTQQRLDELDAHASLLNPLWYAGAFGIGYVAGKLGDKVSYSFMAETEAQVEAHLHSHLDLLPAADHTSRAIVSHMQADEARHGLEARDAGAIPLPTPIKNVMTAAAKVMTKTAYYI